MKNIIHLPNLPKLNESLQVVKTLDDIRFEIDKNDEEGELFEFTWFIREYPRIYRYHLDCAEYRMLEIYKKYEESKEYFEECINKANQNTYEFALSNKSISVMYWNFESFLSSINVALDILSRLVGTAYSEQTPVSFNKLCNKNLDGLAVEFKKAKSVWVSRLKDYRDCFTHYTPVDTILTIHARLYSDGWEIRSKIPTNPNSRDILNFRYSRRTELLKYTISTYKHMMALDKLIAKRIKRLYRLNEYPKRTNNLFNIGSRQ